MKRLWHGAISALVLVAGAGLMALPAQAGEEKPAKQKAQHFEGTISALDAPSRTVTVKKDETSKDFVCSPDCKFATKEKKPAAFADLKVGDQIKVAYKEQDGKLVCRRMGPTAAKEGQPKEQKAAGEKKKKKAE